MRRILAALLFITLAVPIASYAQSATADRPFVVEYYYRPSGAMPTNF